MKEIDFLPDWYKSGQRRQLTRRIQYIALGCIFAIMLTLNLAQRHSVSTARARQARLAPEQVQAQISLKAFDELKNKVAQLEKKADVLTQIDSKVDISNVMGELSFLIDNRIVLSKIEFITEQLKTQKNTNAGVIRRAGHGQKDTKLFGDVRFKVLISGIASDASDVAGLICRLEESPYFRGVYPLFSRNSKGKGGGFSKENLQISEFEIGCYLANYHEQY